MNSSIFSFENLQRAAAIPRELWRWHAVLLLVGIALVPASSLYLHFAVPERVVEHVMMGPVEDARILVVGDSQMLQLFPPAFTEPLCNRALIGSDYVIQEAILKALVPQAPSLKLVIISFDAIPFFVEGLERREGDYRDLVELGVPVWKIPEASREEQFMFFLRYNRLLKPLLVGPKHELMDPYAVEIEARKPAPPPPSGAKPAAGFAVLPTEGKRKMESYALRFKHENNTEANREAFQRMLWYCWDRGIAVALLTPPQTAEFIAARPEWMTGYAAERRAEAEKLAPAGMLEVWDEQGSGKYRVDEFSDPNHISETGGHHFSREVAARADAYLRALRK